MLLGSSVIYEDGNYSRETDMKELKNRNRKHERNLEICKERNAGSSYKTIASKYGISIIRVRQIIDVWSKEA